MAIQIKQDKGFGDYPNAQERWIDSQIERYETLLPLFNNNCPEKISQWMYDSDYVDVKQINLDNVKQSAEEKEETLNKLEENLKIWKDAKKEYNDKGN